MTRRWLILLVLSIIGVTALFVPRTLTEWFSSEAELKKELCKNSVCGARAHDLTCLSSCEQAMLIVPRCANKYPDVKDATNIRWGEDMFEGRSLKCVHL